MWGISMLLDEAIEKILKQFEKYRAEYTDGGSVLMTWIIENNTKYDFEDLTWYVEALDQENVAVTIEEAAKEVKL